MNLLECRVTSILSSPTYYEKMDLWWVEVEYDCYGNKTKTKLTFKTEEEAKDLKIGYTFMA